MLIVAETECVHPHGLGKLLAELSRGPDLPFITELQARFCGTAAIVKVHPAAPGSEGLQQVPQGFAANSAFLARPPVDNEFRCLLFDNPIDIAHLFHGHTPAVNELVEANLAHEYAAHALLE